MLRLNVPQLQNRERRGLPRLDRRGSGRFVVQKITNVSGAVLFDSEYGDPKPTWVVSCASALTVNKKTARHRDAAPLRVNIGHTAVGGHAPTLDGVQMTDRASCRPSSPMIFG